MAQSPADKVIAFLVANAGKEINAAGADYFIDALEPMKADWPRRDFRDKGHLAKSVV